jgi:hypothetical protein
MNAPANPSQRAEQAQPSFPTFGVGGPGPQPTAWLINNDTIDYDGGITVGNPTGGPMGSGTINAINLFIEGLDINAALNAGTAHFGNIDCGVY